LIAPRWLRPSGSGFSYVVSRMVEYAIVLAVAVVINFLLPRALPGGPLKTVGGGQNVGELSSVDQQRVLAEYGLDKSVWEQFWAYVSKLVNLDLGISFGDGQPVISVIAQALPWTMMLVGTSILLTFLIGVTLGSIAGLRRQRGKGTGLLATALACDSIPSFLARNALHRVLRRHPAGTADVRGGRGMGRPCGAAALPRAPGADPHTHRVRTVLPGHSLLDALGADL